MLKKQTSLPLTSVIYATLGNKALCSDHSLVNFISIFEMKVKIDENIFIFWICGSTFWWKKTNLILQIQAMRLGLCNKTFHYGTMKHFMT
jgi:hypothetical protein